MSVTYLLRVYLGPLRSLYCPDRSHASHIAYTITSLIWKGSLIPIISPTSKTLFSVGLGQSELQKRAST